MVMYGRRSVTGVAPTPYHSISVRTLPGQITRDVAKVAIVLAFVGCTQGESPEREPVADVPSESEASPPAPSSDTIPVLDRLREDDGVFTGEPLPRFEHWRGKGAPAYRSAFALCNRVGMRDLAIQLHVDPSSVPVAVVVSSYPRDAWRAAYQGCVDGLVFDRRST